MESSFWNSHQDFISISVFAVTCFTFFLSKNNTGNCKGIGLSNLKLTLSLNTIIIHKEMTRVETTTFYGKFFSMINYSPSVFS